MLRVRQIKHGDWYWVSRTVTQKYGSALGVIALGVYHFLASMVDDNQRCFPSQQLLADRLGCSRSSVNRAIKKLKRKNLIAADKVKRHCHYSLLEVKSSDRKHQVSNSDTSHVQQSYTNDTKLIINNANDMYPVEKLLQTKSLEQTRFRMKNLLMN